MDIDSFKIVTDRLVLRVHRVDDTGFMFDLNAPPEVTRYVPDGPLANEQQALQIVLSLRKQFGERRIGRFLVLDKITGKKLGWCGLKWLEESEEIDLG